MTEHDDVADIGDCAVSDDLYICAIRRGPEAHFGNESIWTDNRHVGM